MQDISGLCCNDRAKCRSARIINSYHPSPLCHIIRRARPTACVLLTADPQMGDGGVGCAAGVLAVTCQMMNLSCAPARPWEHQHAMWTKHPQMIRQD
jgi:hypothetical protein